MKTKKTKYTAIFCLLLLTAFQGKAGGFILTGNKVLQEQSQAINIKIKDQSALTTVDQVFHNPSGSRLEGYFIFPLPPNAVVKDFTMEINGKMMEGEFLDANKAKGIYENIVRSMKDPALLEYSDRGLFRVRIFPIEPRSDKRVKFSYREMLKKDDGNIYYEYSLESPSGGNSGIGSFSVKADIHSAASIKNVYCPSHQAEIVRKSENHVITGFEGSDAESSLSFQLFYRTDSQPFGISLLSYKQEGEDGYFFANISPGFASEQEVSQKDVTFVLDVSGSMAGKNLDQAKKSLLFCINNLNRDDRFELIRFSTEANALFGHLADASENNLRQATDYIDNFRAIGGTNIEEALQLALGNKSAPDRPHIVVFITDGKPTIGETNEEQLLTSINNVNTNNTRIFTFGIGHDLNTHLLDRLTEATRAYRTYATPEEDLELKLSSFFTKISSPVMMNLQLDFPGTFNVHQVYPKSMPDLFNGSSVMVMGRYGSSGENELVLSGVVNGKKVQYEYPIKLISDGTENDFIPSLWASRAVGYLLDQIRLQGESGELKQEVVRLAQKHGIITPYTSYLILEDEALQTRNNLNRGLPLPAPLQESRSFEESETAYEGVRRDKSGAGSVKASKEIQAMKQAQHLSDGGYNDFRKTAVKIVKGKTFYHTARGWQESEMKEKGKEKLRLQFGSDEYFQFADKNPETSPFLALGKEVRFIYRNKVIEVFVQ